MRERVLEGVDQLRNKARLVEKVGCLKMPQGPMQCLRRQLGNGLEEWYGYFGADDCRTVWRRRFSSAGRRSIRAANTARMVSGIPGMAGEGLCSIMAQLDA